MLNNCFKIITMYTVISVANGRNCENRNQIEKPSKRTNESEKNEHHGSTEDSTVTNKPRRRCCPYDFDSSLCQIVDNRVLCGYNRNIGQPLSDDSTVNVNNGCRLKGGRLECGYQQGPFTNPRRPPSVDQQQPDYFYNSETDDDRTNDKDGNGKNTDAKDSEEKEQMKLVERTTRTERKATKCVEIDNRIVCRFT